jgi:hypothetical protein
MEEEETIAKSTHLRRLQAKQEALDLVNDKYGKLEKAHAELTTKQADTPDYAKLEKRYNRLMKTHEDLQVDFDGFKANATTERALLSAGLTDEEDQWLVRARWERIDEGQRPSLSDYLAEGGPAREDRHLKALFTVEPPAAKDDETQKRPRRSTLPSTQKNATGTAPPAKGLSREAILNMSVAERVKPENREAIRAALEG